MSEDHQDQWRRLDEAHQIWDEPQFLLPEVCQITGASPKALEHFLNPARGMVHLMGDWVNPGTGKRRRFTGEQVLKIAAAYAMSRIGFPQRFSIDLSEAVWRRAMGRTNGLAQKSGLTILTYPMKNGDWAIIPVYNEDTSEPRLPAAVQVLDVDRLIDEVQAQLQAIVAGAEIPDFTVPDILPEPDYFSPKVNGNLDWEKDGAGRWVFVGLNADETRELMESRGMSLDGDDIRYEPSKAGNRGNQTLEEGERITSLSDRHEMARLKACADAVAARMRAAD